MNLFDIFILSIISFGLTRGIFRGFFIELSSIAGVFLGYYMACSYYNALASKPTSWMHNQSYLNILSFLLIFTSVVLIVEILSLFIKYFMNLTKIGWTNRVYGGFLGILKSSLLVAMLLIILITFIPKDITFIKDSRLSPYFVRIIETSTISIPTDMKVNL